MPERDKQRYIDRFWKDLLSTGQDESSRSSYNGRSQPLAHYFAVQDQGSVDLVDLPGVQSQHSAGGPIAIVIENISTEWMATLGPAWGIESSFFVAHASNPHGTDLWQSILDPSQRQIKRASQRNRLLSYSAVSDATGPASFEHETWRCWHVDGVLQRTIRAGEPASPKNVKMSNAFARRLEISKTYGWQSNTRVSCAFTKSCYLLLVDRLPIFTAQSCSQPSTKLHLPSSKSRGGLMIPQLFDRHEFSLFECLCRFLSHNWHFDVLFAEPPDRDKFVSSETFLYLVVASTWAGNQRHLKSRIRRIAFEDIRRPNIQITDSLHDCRHNLDELRTEVAYTKSWIPAVVHEELTEIRTSLDPDAHVRLPADLLQTTFDEAETTEKFLMDTYQLLMSSISVLDSQTSIDQARRAQTLTQLALIYVPFSFVTSIFGMNVKEINGSSLSVWVCVPVLVVTFVLTAILFKLYALATGFAKGDGWRQRQTTHTAQHKSLA